MSDDTRRSGPSLAEAASEFEQELVRFEELAANLARLTVTSEKTLQRARQGLDACAESEQRLAGNLVAFGRAMQAFQERQQRCMNSVLDSAKRIEARHLARKELLGRVGALGQRANDVTGPMERLSQGGVGAAELMTSMKDIATQLESVIAEAGEVAGAAQQAEWLDIARDVDLLKQQLQAARNKVLLAQRDMANRMPS